MTTEGHPGHLSDELRRVVKDRYLTGTPVGHILEGVARLVEPQPDEPNPDETPGG